jgi:hypothetical protein
MENKKQCSKCGEWTTTSNFRPNPPGWKKKSDGFDGVCRGCRSDYERERQRVDRLGLAMFGDLRKIPGIDLCPCDEGGEICVYWKTCCTQEVMCNNFKSWSSSGRKNNLEKVPYESIYSKK